MLSSRKTQVIFGERNVWLKGDGEAGPAVSRTRPFINHYALESEILLCFIFSSRHPGSWWHQWNFSDQVTKVTEVSTCSKYRQQEWQDLLWVKGLAHKTTGTAGASSTEAIYHRQHTSINTIFITTSTELPTHNSHQFSWSSFHFTRFIFSNPYLGII